MPDPFLAAVAAAPADRTPRLVYADWLDERGDPRGELIRVEEEMRQLPAHADRYWALKPRRNALRAAADEDWLAEMGYGTRYEPVFREVPDDVRGRWRLIREHVDRWFAMPLPDAGGHADEIARVEREVGLPLPPSVREWVAFYRDVYAADEDGVVFRDCPGIARLDALGAVSLMIQGESDYHWAVPTDLLAVPDPPVDGYRLDYDADDPDRFEFDHRMSATVTGFTVQYLKTYHHVSRTGPEVTDPDALARELAGAFPSHARFGELWVFEADDVIAFLGPEYHAASPWQVAVSVRGPVPRRRIPEVLLANGYVSDYDARKLLS